MPPPHRQLCSLLRSLPRSSAAAPNFSVGCFEVFLSGAACLAVWVSPHMWHAAGEGLTAPSLSLLVFCLFIFLKHFLNPPSVPTTFQRLCFGGSPPCAYTPRVELFLYGEGGRGGGGARRLHLIAVQGPCSIQWLPCSEAPRFLN